MALTKIKKDDLVEVVTGNDKGKRGKVLRMVSGSDRVLVEKVNMVKRHTKPTQMSQGGIVDKETSIHISNLALVCTKCDKPVRSFTKVLEGGARVRACRSCGEGFDS